MQTYYKATRPDGRDFYSDTVDYAGALESGKALEVSTRERDRYECCSSDVLHASDVAAETLIGGSWPCRLFLVTGTPVASEGHKYGFRSLHVTEEVPAHLALGPLGEHVVAMIEQARGITPTQADELRAVSYVARYAARDVAWDATRSAARSAAWHAAGYVAGYVAWDTAGDAAAGLSVRDLIGTADYLTLTGDWRRIVGRIHPDDPSLNGE
jgi:hypothetical protein